MMRRYLRAVACLALILAVVVVLRLQRVTESAMQPTLEPEDVVVVNRCVFATRLPYRGEIVRVLVGGGERTLRVIGIGGDTVEIKHSEVRIGGALVPEPYRTPITFPERRTDQGTWRVPGGSVFLLGDNRANADDSRRFGCVRVDALSGSVVYRLLPASRRGWFG